LLTGTGSAIFGHFNGYRGVLYDGGFKTNQVNVGTQTNWINMVGTNSTSVAAPNNVLLDGAAMAIANGGTGNQILRIGAPSEASDFQFSHLIIWNQALTAQEMVYVSNAFTSYLSSGTSLFLPIPDAPTIGLATSSGYGTVSVTFTAPYGKVTSYTVTSSPGGFTGSGTTSPITVSGLTANTAYTFTVTATNTGGTSPSSTGTPSVTTMLLSTAYNTLLTTKVPWGRYSATSWVSGTNTLTDLTGNGRHATTTNLTNGTASGNGATASIAYLQGTGSTARIIWPDGSIPATHTICFITRYSGSNRNVLLGQYGPGANYMIGHSNGYAGIAYYDATKTNPTNSINSTNWLNFCGTTGNSTPNNFLANGTGVGTSTGGTSTGLLGINNYPYGGVTDFQFSQLIIWNQVLTPSEMGIVSDSFTNYLSTGTLG
jgi:hypothetical protein